MSEPAVRCRYCPEMILWARSENGNAMCFDAAPSPRGVWDLDKPVALYVRQGDEKPGQKLFESHWGSCSGRVKARAEHPRRSR